MNLALPTAHPHPPPDLPMWDRLFGIERNADEFAARCGFPRDNERKRQDAAVPGRLQRLTPSLS
jgi:hypothetical protein